MLIKKRVYYRLFRKNFHSYSIDVIIVPIVPTIVCQSGDGGGSSKWEGLSAGVGVFQMLSHLLPSSNWVGKIMGMCTTMYEVGG